MAQTIIEPLNRPVQSTTTFAGLMEAARAVKMHWQNVRKQNKFDDVFATVETREKELERCQARAHSQSSIEKTTDTF